MIAVAQPVPRLNGAAWTGCALSALTILMLVLDGAMKLAKPAPVVETMAHLGYPNSATLGIGVLLLACTAVYAIPQTTVLGAILLTGYLGGATASHVRVGADLFPVLFPALIGALVWGGLFLRDEDVIEFKSDDHRVLTAHALGDDGEWHGFMTTHYYR